MELEIRPIALALALSMLAVPAAAQDGADELAAPGGPGDVAGALAAPHDPEPEYYVPPAAPPPSSSLAVELGIRVTHGVSMEIADIVGGQLATWVGASLAFGGERFSGTLSYDVGIGTMTNDRVAHTVSLRAGYDLESGPRHTRITLSVGPLLRLGLMGTTQCSERCTASEREAYAATVDQLPMAVGGVLALDALYPFDAWLVGLSAEIRGSGPVEPLATSSIEILLGIRVAVDFAKL